MNNETCYLVIFDDFPGLHQIAEPFMYTEVEKVYKDLNKAVEFVREHADDVKYEQNLNPDHITIVYDGPFENWPWMFTWEENTRQYTYKIIPRTYDD